jgi:hypothetical protein
MTATPGNEIFRRGSRSASVSRVAAAMIFAAGTGGTMDDHQVKYVLQESQLPRHWYNIVADLPAPPPPPLHPGTGQPVGPDDLARCSRPR